MVPVPGTAPLGAARETSGTFVFANVPSNSSTDLANGLTFAVLAGNPHRASGPIKVLSDGLAQRNWDSVPESFFATDDTTNIRIQVKLSTIHDIGEINTYSWHRNSRSRQQYRVYAALAPSNNAPDFTAASFQDDPVGDEAIPNWNRVLSARPDFPRLLAEAAQQDAAEFAQH